MTASAATPRSAGRRTAAAARRPWDDSVGSTTFTVLAVAPDVVAGTVDAAAELLNAAGLVLGTVTPEGAAADAVAGGQAPRPVRNRRPGPRSTWRSQPTRAPAPPTRRTTSLPSRTSLA